MRVLYVGGTGEISKSCVEAAIAAGQQVTLLNRGKTNQTPPPAGAQHIEGDFSDPDVYAQLAGLHFDVVCQFLVYTTEAMQRDIEFFSGRCQQYIFISTASAYLKPLAGERITEATPLANPFWAYSRSKAACERLLQEADIPSTIVRPSHTYRARLPSIVIDGNHLAWRLLRGLPVVVPNGGDSLWTLTHAEDFARALVQLSGHDQAIGEAFHITSDEAWGWADILREVASALDCELDLRRVETGEVVKRMPALEGPLLGDKVNHLQFDNSKIRTVANDWRCRVTLSEGIKSAAEHVRHRLAGGYDPDPAVEYTVNQLITDLATQPV